MSTPDDRPYIIVNVAGGVVQSIEDIPAGVRVVIRDYDIDGAEEADLVTDPDGAQHVLSVWEQDRQPTAPGETPSREAVECASAGWEADRSRASEEAVA